MGWFAGRSSDVHDLTAGLQGSWSRQTLTLALSSFPGLCHPGPDCVPPWLSSPTPRCLSFFTAVSISLIPRQSYRSQFIRCRAGPWSRGLPDWKGSSDPQVQRACSLAAAPSPLAGPPPGRTVVPVSGRRRAQPPEVRVTVRGPPPKPTGAGRSQGKGRALVHL